MRRNNTNSKSRQTGRLTGVLLLITTFLLIGFVGLFLWQKIFYREEIAKMLPAEQTLGFVEVNLDLNSSDLQQFFQLSSSNPYLNQPVLQKFLYSLPPHSESFQKWFGGRLGVALIAQAHQNPATVTFLKFNDYQEMLAWKSRSFLENEHINESNQLLIIGNYLIISESPAALELISQTFQNQNNSLKNHPDYNQIYSALPQQNLAFIYFDTGKILATLGENPNFLAGRLNAFQQFLPFLKIFSREAIAIYTNKDSNGKISLQAQQLSLFNKAILPATDFFNIKYFYSGALENSLPSNTIASFGGTNLADQKVKIEALFANQSTVQSLLFSGSLEKFKQEVFIPSVADQTNLSNKIDLNQDFFGIIKENYLFSIQSGNKGDFDYSFVIENKNALNDILKVQKLLLALAKNAAAKTQTSITDVTLPDGTKGQNIVGTLIEPQAVSEQIEGVSVQSIAISDSMKIYYLASDSKIFISTNSKSILEMIRKNKEVSSSNKVIPLLPQLDHPTEYYFFDLNAAAQSNNMPQIQPIFPPIQKLKIGRKFTQIGVLSMYSLEQ